MKLTPSTRTLDGLWRELIRIMYDGKCAMCLRDGHDCHHVVSRSDLRQRWHPLNGTLLCKEHHEWAHSHPEEFKAWLADNLTQVYENSISGGFTFVDRIEIRRTLNHLKNLADKRSRAGSVRLSILPAIVFSVVIAVIVTDLYLRLTR